MGEGVSNCVAHEVLQASTCAQPAHGAVTLCGAGATDQVEAHASAAACHSRPAPHTD